MSNTPNPYFLNPFAIDSNDVAVIPSTGASTGAMSYQQGFTINYEQDLETVSTALPIPRNQFNQLMLDITAALQQLQNYGYPNWVAPATGSPLVGGPVSYPLNAVVLYSDGNIYQSQIASNTSVPGADANWVVISLTGKTISSQVLAVSAVSVSTSGTDITSIVLPVGVWNVSGNIYFASSAASAGYSAWINTTSVTAPDNSLIANIIPFATPPNASFLTSAGLVVPTQQITVTSGTQNVYLTGMKASSASTTGCGLITAIKN